MGRPRKVFVRAGERYGSLVVVHPDAVANTSQSVRRRAACVCDCGADTLVDIGKLVDGHTSSCGCKKRGSQTRQDPHYSRWWAMVDRCHNPRSQRYADYGGRGIAVCDEWRYDLQAFSAWVDALLGPCPPGCSLDRIDNAHGYRPGNLRWATAREQANNRRSNRRVTT